MTTLNYLQTQEYPNVQLTWNDSTGAPINFSTGYTFTVQLAADGVAKKTVTSGITGAATSPNITIAWNVGDLNITPGTYDLILTARDGAGKDRVFRPGEFPQIQIFQSPTTP